MVARNAFENLATDSLLRRLLHAVSFARDSGDRMVVSLGASPTVIPTFTEWLNANVYAAMYSSGAPTSMDAREQQRVAARANVQQVRQGRWTFT